MKWSGFGRGLIFFSLLPAAHTSIVEVFRRKTYAKRKLLGRLNTNTTVCVGAGGGRGGAGGAGGGFKLYWVGEIGLKFQRIHFFHYIIWIIFTILTLIKVKWNNKMIMFFLHRPFHQMRSECSVRESDWHLKPAKQCSTGFSLFQNSSS